MLEDSLMSRVEALRGILFLPGSTFSITSLLSALVVCAAAFVWRRRARGRRVRLQGLLRYALPMRLFLHRSSRTDLILFVLQILAFGALLGWTILSQSWIAGQAVKALTFAFGEAAPAPIHPVAAAIIITLASFLAYEFGYWVSHWASHTHPLLWEYHKIHHTAEVLTPLTVWRVHPLEQVIFLNILAISIGVCEGAGRYLLGGGVQIYALSGANIILVFFVYAVVHLQHSQAWIAFTGVWGRLFLSPAHHQIHHSANPIHHNRNLGSCLAIWDWAFGTLFVPAREREVEKFGLGDDNALDPQDTVAALFDPLYRTVDYFTPRPAPENLTPDAAPQPAPAGR